jgi:hypothetical protein
MCGFRLISGFLKAFSRRISGNSLPNNQLPNNEQVFDDKSSGEGWQNDPGKLFRPVNLTVIHPQPAVQEVIIF